MPKLNLKLGEPSEEFTSPVLVDRPQKFYPSFRIQADEKPELPSEGTMTIRFKKVSSEERKDEDGDEHYSCTIEVHEVVDAYPEEGIEPPARSRSKDTEDALDNLKAGRKLKSNAY